MKSAGEGNDIPAGLKEFKQPFTIKVNENGEEILSDDSDDE